MKVGLLKRSLQQEKTMKHLLAALAILIVCNTAAAQPLWIVPDKDGKHASLLFGVTAQP